MTSVHTSTLAVLASGMGVANHFPRAHRPGPLLVASSWRYVDTTVTTGCRLCVDDGTAAAVSWVVCTAAKNLPAVGFIAPDAAHLPDWAQPYSDVLGRVPKVGYWSPMAASPLLGRRFATIPNLIAWLLEEVS